MRIIFFNITGMEFYNGIENGDEVSSFGGEYVKRNRIGGEIYNFQDYNGFCYGFVNTKSGTIKIERIDDLREDDDSIDDVLVIWTAKHSQSEKNVIVGWYKNATVFKYEQYAGAFPNVGRDIYYYCLAKADNCFLLPIENRDFIIERAKDKGKGKGMGQANIWFADSDYGKNEFVPTVVEYVMNYNGLRINTVFNDETLQVVLNEKEAGLGKFSDSQIIDALTDKGRDLLEIGDYYRALAYFNTSLKKSTEDFKSNLPVDIESNAYYNIGLSLMGLNCFNKSIECFEKVLQLEGDSEDVLGRLIYLYEIKNMNKEALSTSAKLLKMFDDSEIEKICEAYGVIADTYTRMGQIENAVIALDEIISRSQINDVKEHAKSVKYNITH